MKYNSDQLDEMAEKIDIVDYIGQVEQLYRKGKNYFTNCPFHKGDNTPSLCIYPDTNKWYCFGCGAGSNIYDWIRLYDQVPFGKAVKKVAELTDSNLIEYTESESMSFLREMQRNKMPQQNSQQEREILDWQKDYFDKYSDELPEEWLAEDMTAEALKTYNIRIDKLANRIVYPVTDADGRLIGVKGRTRIEAYKELRLPKYINYTKIGTIDYMQGWEQALPHIKSQKSVIIFEGIKSCIKTWGWGIKNTVASETSALSDGQLQLLIKMSIPEIIIAWDSDQKLRDIISNSKIQMLRKFTAVSIITDNKGWLGEKEAPVDQGETIFRELLSRRYRL
jgi:DNA primase